MTRGTGAGAGPAGPTPAADLVRATFRRRRELAAVTLWALLGALPTFAGGQVIARAVDDGFLAGRPATGLAWLGLLAATVPLGAVGTRRTYTGVARLVEPLRDDLVRTVVSGTLERATGTTSPAAFAGPATAGGRDDGAVARLTQHVEAVRETVAGLLLLVLAFVGGVVAALAGLASLAPVVLPLVVVPLLAAGGAFAASLPALTRQQRRLLVTDEDLAGTAAGTAEGLRDVVACGGEESVAGALDRRIEANAAAGRGMARVTATRTLIVAVGGRLPVVLVLLSAGWLLDRGLSAGVLLGTLTYLIQGLEPAVSSVADGVGVPLAQLAMTVRRLDEEAAPAGGAGRPPSGVEPPDAALLLRGVTFRYRDDAEPVVDRLDLAVPDGDHLAVVGPSGAGKSTLAALLVGVLHPQRGEVRHGGRPPATVAAGSRVLIPQHAYVFRGTLDENLRYLHPLATPGARDRAVEAVGADRLVERLGGYGAEIDPGTLSMGERQLVALARAHLTPARLMVLDEATCYLDPGAEAVAEQAFAARDGTLVVVAHRISSARRARRILVVDGDETVVGSHEELLERSALYRDLVGHWHAAT